MKSRRAHIAISIQICPDSSLTERNQLPQNTDYLNGSNPNLSKVKAFYLKIVNLCYFYNFYKGHLRDLSNIINSSILQNRPLIHLSCRSLLSCLQKPLKSPTMSLRSWLSTWWARAFTAETTVGEDLILMCVLV